jgi:hypothetical protein
MGGISVWRMIAWQLTIDNWRGPFGWGWEGWVGKPYEKKNKQAEPMYLLD